MIEWMSGKIKGNKQTSAISGKKPWLQPLEAT